MAPDLPAERDLGLVGFLVIDDRAPGQQLAPDDPNFGKHALIAVARVQREFWNQSTVGALFTDYQFAGSSEQVFSLDTRLRLWSNLVFTGQAVRSQADYPWITSAGIDLPRGTQLYGIASDRTINLA
jgi:hypothetical protein